MIENISDDLEFGRVMRSLNEGLYDIGVVLFPPVTSFDPKHRGSGVPAIYGNSGLRPDDKELVR